MSAGDVDPLMAKLAAGDERTFQTVYRRYADRLYRVALRILNHSEDAEDAVQQVFTSLVHTQETLTRVNDLSGYLFASLRRAAGKIAVRSAKQPIADTELTKGAPAAESAKPADSPHSDRLSRCLAALPAKQREVIALKIEGRLTFAQIGEALGVSPKTAASRYRLALEKLRRYMEGRSS